MMNNKEIYIFEKFGRNAHKEPRDYKRFTFEILYLDEKSAQILIEGKKKLMLPSDHEYLTSSILLSESRWAKPNPIS